MKTAYTQPLQNADYNLSWITAHLDIRGNTGCEYLVICPIHDDSSPSMRINIEKGLYYCFACGTKGSLQYLAKAINIPFNALNKCYDVNSVIKKINQLIIPNKLSETIHNETELSRYSFNCNYWSDAIPYGRGFTIKTINTFKLGYDPLDNAATIPIYDINNQFLGCTKRYLSKSSHIKYRDPKGFHKAENLYASWLAVKTKKNYLVITEGPLDCVNVWQSGHPCVAQFGSTLTQQQRELINYMDVPIIVLAYDCDNAGKLATFKAIGFTLDPITNKLRYNRDNDLRRNHLVYKINYNKTFAKDPGAIASQRLRMIINKALASKRSAL